MNEQAEMAQIIADAARTSDAAHWPEAVARALIAAGYEKVAHAATELTQP